MKSTPDSESFSELRELWSPEARAASIAVRQGRVGRRPPKGRVKPRRRQTVPEPEKPDAPQPNGKPEPDRAAEPGKPDPRYKEKEEDKPKEWSTEEAPEETPGQHEFESIRSAMGRSERDALDAGYEKSKAEGFKGSRADFLKDTQTKYETEEEDESTAKTWLSGTTMDRLTSITKKKKQEAAHRLADVVDSVIRESDMQLFGTSDYDDLMEAWGPAARAASAASRRAKGGGKAGTKEGRAGSLPRCARWSSECFALGQGGSA